MWTAVELRELRVFLALADELHFGRTAERLQISQPGVSAAIRSLEGHLGGQLFDRTSRRVTLTPAGQELRCTIAPILGELQDALARASDLAVGLGGELCIGITSTTHGPPLSRLLEAFRSQHPKCQVILHEVDSGDPYAALRRGEADVLVNWLAVDEPDLTAGPVIALHDRVLVVARGHHLAARTSVLLEDLGDQQVTLLPPTFPPALYDAILPPRTPSGRPIARTQLVRSITEIAAHVAHGKIVHITMIGVPVFARNDLVFVPIQDLAPTALGLIWRTERYSAKVRALVGTAQTIGPVRLTTDRPPPAADQPHPGEDTPAPGPVPAAAARLRPGPPVPPPAPGRKS
jgi:DNA-binding transcriptional LysR family regulator